MPGGASIRPFLAASYTDVGHSCALRKYRWRPQLRDPGDEMVLETAVNGQAQAIVTFNRRDYSDKPGTFGIEVLSPAEALRRMQE